MKLRLKDGVIIKEINEAFLTFCDVVYNVYHKHFVIPTITSANDGEHIETSLHYKNLAWDLRIWGLNNVQEVADELRLALKDESGYWQVVYGDTHHLNHIHVEFDVN